jgi:hypothetical protein
MKMAVEAGDRTVTVNNWSPETRSFHVSLGAAPEARIRAFFYPHWHATAAGRELAVRPDQNGALMVALPNEATDVTVEFREPPRAHYATVSALMASFLIGGLLVSRRRLFSNLTSQIEPRA